MSSRLNPRDYDLGELRDAVSESPRRRGDGRADGRRDEATAGEEQVPQEDGDDADAERAAETGSEFRPAVERRTGDDGTGRRDSLSSGVRRADAASSPGERAGSESTREDDGRSVGRMRHSTARSWKSASRDRTSSGEPRRRNRTDDRERSGRRPEKRRGDAGRSSSTSGPDGGPAVGLEMLGAGADGGLERPYLDRLPDSYRAQLEVLEWLERLVGTCGREGTIEALAYYESVGWLSGESRGALEDFLEGLSAVEPPDPRSLDVDDHRESLRYVVRLAHLVDR